MKIIDLLDKIANNSDLPEKIKFDYLEFRLNKNARDFFGNGYHIDYLNDNRTNLFTDYIAHDIVKYLNDSVEILKGEYDNE